MNWLYQNDRSWLEEQLPTPHVARTDYESRREKLIQLMNDYPNANRTELKKLGKGVTRWLYRHDREWLEQSLPPRLK